MAENSPNRPNYGHPGEASFDIDQKRWIFSRQTRNTTLEQIGLSTDEKPSSTEVIPSPIRIPDAAASTRATDARSNARELVHANPQLAPATDVLPELAVTSAAIHATTAIYDPLIGDIFSIGSVTFEDLWENPRRVAAVVTGESRNVLRLVFFYKEIQGWGRDKSLWLRGETLIGSESGYWNQEAAPIQQVCFSQSEDRSSLLAVRLPTTTVIFRPFYTSRPQPANQSSYFDLPSSRIVSHPILSLGIDESGGSFHADVTFNPDFQLQFAVVDQNQTWSVWDIEHGRKSFTYTISCLVQGPISDDIDTVGEDGWARILWVGDVNTILVCNRRHLSVISIESGTFSRLSCPMPVATRSYDWILDVKRHPSSRNRFFVLTTSMLSLMEVTTANDAQDVAGGKAGARVIVSCMHYRGAEDFTLNMSVQMLTRDLSQTTLSSNDGIVSALAPAPEEVCVLLHSRLNDLVQSHNFQSHSLDSSAIVTSDNPNLLNLTIGGAGYINHLRLDLLEFQGDATSSASSLGHSYLTRRLRFYKLLVSRSDLSVHEGILVGHDSREDGEAEISTVVEAPSRISVYRPRRVIRSIKKIEEMEAFIVPDGVEALNGPVSKLTVHSVQRKGEKGREARSPRVARQSLLYQILTKQELDDDTTSSSITLAVVARQLKAMFSDEASHTQLPLGTLLEFAGSKIDVADVDESSGILSEVFTAEADDNTAVPIQIASPRILHLAENAPTTISSLYDTILQSWVAPLPPDVPIRVRQHKERIARRIAAEVMLASTRIRLREPQVDNLLTQPRSSQYRNISLPILSSRPPENSLLETTQWPSSQSLPTPPQSSGQDSSQPPSSPPVPPVPAQPISDPLVRLSKHLKFKDDTIDPVPISPNVDQLLAHWQLGVHPSTYNWEGIEQSLHTDNIDEDSQQRSEKERRRRERRQKKQQRENELMRTQPSSQPFVLPNTATFPRSSPGPMLGGIGSSSQAPSQPHNLVPLPSSQPGGFGSFGSLVVQSQIEPGKHGGRTDKKKKKKRIGGF